MENWLNKGAALRGSKEICKHTKALDLDGCVLFVLLL
jgi:hypothetical protein